MGALELLLLLLSSAFSSASAAKSVAVVSTVLFVVGILFSVAWLIAGSVFVYGTRPGTYEDDTANDFCDHTAYWFAFVATTLGNISFGLFLFCCLPLMICFGGLMAFVSASEE